MKKALLPDQKKGENQDFFELAHRGTIFLDEIDLTSLLVQKKAAKGFAGKRGYENRSFKNSSN